MSNLVSIIMLARNKADYAVDSIKSVIAQTYTNWELIFIDDSSTDGTISKVLESDFNDKRMRFSQFIFEQGESVTRHKAIFEAKGRWVAFINCGDLWKPTKLEEQIAFMESRGCYFSYTKYGIIDSRSNVRKVIIGGPACINHNDMLKCCWPGYLTVMYDASQIKLLTRYKYNDNNDYAIWLEISKQADCYLLDKNLATQRSDQGLYSPFPFFDRIRWRYNVFIEVEKMNPFVAALMTAQSIWYGIFKKVKYSSCN